ncbi:NAD(P)/FAD-dependent oxidoreductase [Streptosporangium lutulentum]|uniref:NADPH-dependent 2,4-dienoyl-CoA reductase/sulfur reductase-like enzyme n=1 Tax=Streptosporangium lutulentum TaxID=1461250 RepID=A0ABT9QD22_9ACTN|nr:FAD/NAD(P)-binding oxidoreductase [Streptosporangium lutulentum]MDP9844665.1 NADPH-dependent 2,4-dienoyl-CoA reductase/sulfur reductase-like enzyme [Streptosporangium lutulentum]
MKPIYDLAVVGAGPAGVAGALTASLAGLSVVLLDAAARPGGQYFRHPPEGFHAEDPGALHHGLARFVRQWDTLRGRADVLLRHRVWAVERADETVTVRCLEGDREERPRTITARRLLIATGAHDRPVPFPGWDLPGVLTAGGAQALLKGDLVVAGRRVVVSGTGPFLLPVAAGLADAGAKVLGVHEANGRFGLAAHPLLAAGKAGEALGYGARLARHGVPYHGRQAVIAAHGDVALTHVTVARLDSGWRPISTRTVECDTLAYGYGFVPQLDLPVQLGCATRGDADGSPVVAVDAGLRTSVPGVYAAGESTGVGGAVLAEVEGRLAGRTAAADLGRRVPPDPALSRRRDRLAAFARALQSAYPVRPGWMGWLRDDTLICRCEEVPLSAVREAQELGATDARSVKLLARPGMGWCQGRICGYAVACLAGEDPAAPRRPIAQPIRLGDLAASTRPPSG